MNTHSEVERLEDLFAAKQDKLMFPQLTTLSQVQLESYLLKRGFVPLDKQKTRAIQSYRTPEGHIVEFDRILAQGSLATADGDSKDVTIGFVVPSMETGQCRVAPSELSFVGDPRFDVTQLMLVSEGQLQQRIKIPVPELCPPLVLIGTACRSGGTAFLNSCACAGYESHFQRIKTILRHLYVGGDISWQVPTGQRPVVVKESFGPYFPEEARLDVLAHLLNGGYPPEKIHVIIMLREPKQTLASWLAYFPMINVHRFIESYLQPLRLRQQAHALGIGCITYVYEAIANNPSGITVRRLFQRAGLAYSDNAINWTHTPSFGTRTSNIMRDKEPDRFSIIDIHRRVKEGNSFMYSPRDTSLLSCEQVQTIADLSDVYMWAKQECEQQLGIEIA